MSARSLAGHAGRLRSRFANEDTRPQEAQEPPGCGTGRVGNWGLTPGLCDSRPSFFTAPRGDSRVAGCLGGLSACAVTRPDFPAFTDSEQGRPSPSQKPTGTVPLCLDAEGGGGRLQTPGAHSPRSVSLHPVDARPSGDPERLTRAEPRRPAWGRLFSSVWLVPGRGRTALRCGRGRRCLSTVGGAGPTQASRPPASSQRPSHPSALFCASRSRLATWAEW